jgi:hypothetical protein
VDPSVPTDFGGSLRGEGDPLPLVASCSSLSWKHGGKYRADPKKGANDQTMSIWFNYINTVPLKTWGLKLQTWQS